MSHRIRPAIAGVVLLALIVSSCGSLPSLREERQKARPLAQTSFLYAANGDLITPLHAGEDRVVVPSSKIPDVVRNAVVAIEDKRFFEHPGIDLRALLRAVYINASSGKIVEGGSTITQQYVKKAYVGDAPTLSRKIEEAYLAWQLEHRLTKDQILTKYLNTVYFGNGAYGIEAAAQTYFDRPASTLTLGQAALLAGVIAAPSEYDPIAHPDHSRARRNEVLEQMLETGAISSARYDRAVSTRVRLVLGTAEEREYLAPHFVDYFKEWFLSNPRFGETQQERYDLLFRGGLRITTTLVPRLQLQAERAVNSILVYRSDPYGAMTVIDPRTGFVRAMVGGRDYWDTADGYARINLATGGSTGRQAGSSFKVFGLVAALEHGISPTDTFEASSVSIPLVEGTVWQPENYDGSAYGTISLESATVNSVNVAYVNIEQAIGDGDIYEGAGSVVEAAKRMGIRCCRRTSEPSVALAAVPSAILGTNEVNTLEMASAYGTLAFAGQHVQPTPVVRITTADGQVLYESAPKPKQVIVPAVVTVADQILQKVVQYGTGVAANIGRPQIGKTGTAQNWHDAWFVGAVPQLAAAVWVGFPQGEISMAYPTVRLSHVLGGTWPAQIWHAFMVNATRNLTELEFPTAPVEYVTVDIDVTEGCLASAFTPPENVESVRFIVGTEPTEICDEPSSTQYLTVPAVLGLDEATATTALRAAGFNVRVETAISTQPEGTVVSQDPGPNVQALQASTVVIVVARAAESPPPATATVPNVVGMTRGAASAALRADGFRVTTIADRECEPADPGCDYREGVVWAQAPSGGTEVAAGSTVTIVANP